MHLAESETNIVKHPIPSLLDEQADCQNSRCSWRITDQTAREPSQLDTLLDPIPDMFGDCHESDKLGWLSKLMSLCATVTVVVAGRYYTLTLVFLLRIQMNELGRIELDEVL